MPKGRNIPRWLLDEPIAHRGLHDNPGVPENSLSAFCAAIQTGIPIEIDVHLLADRKPVVFHDQNLLRMTGVAGRINEYDSQTIRALRLLKTEQTIPLLSETLREIDGAVPILIELKSLHFIAGELERAVLCELQNYKGAFAVQSFNALSINYFRRYAPAVCRGQLSTGYLGSPLAGLTQPDFIAYNVNFLSERLTSHLRRSGAALLAWTIRNTTQLTIAKTFADNYIFEAASNFMPGPFHSQNSDDETPAHPAASWGSGA